MNRPLIQAFKAIVAYDGTGYAGSQLQENAPSVMGEINSALARILDHSVRVKAASRTDAGVHATGQVIGFRTSADRQPDEIRRGLNSLLPDSIRIMYVAEADFKFHPRHSAVGKVYRYRMYRGEVLPPMLRNYALFIDSSKPFYPDGIALVIKSFKGKHDFSSFTPRLEDGENPVKDIWGTDVLIRPPGIEFVFAGSGFLYQMARRMAGLALAVGQDREFRDSVIDALSNPVVGKVIYNAKPLGLFLERVIYSEKEKKAYLAELSVS